MNDIQSNHTHEYEDVFERQEQDEWLKVCKTCKKTQEEIEGICPTCHKDLHPEPLCDECELRTGGKPLEFTPMKGEEPTWLAHVMKSGSEKTGWVSAPMGIWLEAFKAEYERGKRAGEEEKHERRRKKTIG